jgi:DNA-3-methyladenine glycosylase II
VRAVTYQQLNGRAAATIFARFVASFGNGRFPSPQAVLAANPRSMRRAGLSRAKALAIKDIARHAVARVVPTRRGADRLADDEIIERLTQIRGVGRWTVEMLLIFTLGRPDVLPVDDYGVREGYRLAYGLKKQPAPKELAAIGERWKPYRSAVAWYFWQVANEARAKSAKPPAKSAKPPAKSAKEARAKSPGANALTK